MTQRISTVLTVLAASLVLAAPATVASAGSAPDGGSSVAGHRHGCC